MSIYQKRGYLVFGIFPLLIISACGGGDGSSGAPPISVVPGPSPSPTSSPSPTPSPSATVVYPVVNDLTQDLLIDGRLGLTVDLFEPVNKPNPNFVSAPLFPDGTNYTLSYTAAPEAVRFAIHGVSESYGAADRTNSSSRRIYRRTGAPDLRIGPLAGGNARYVTTIISTIDTNEVRGGVAGLRRSNRIGLAGRPTLPSDPLPGPGGNAFPGTAALYGGLVDQEFYESGDAPIWRIEMDGAVRGFVSALQFAGPSQVILEFTGTLDRTTGSIQGTIAEPRTGFAGVFRGNLFGPAGAELGIVYRAQRSSDGAVLAGTFIGVR